MPHQQQKAIPVQPSGIPFRYPYEAPVNYITPSASPETSVWQFPPSHGSRWGEPSLPPQPHQWVYPNATPGVYLERPPLVPHSRPGIVQPVKSVPGNRSFEFVNLQAPRIPTAGDPRLGLKIS